MSLGITGSVRELANSTRPMDVVILDASGNPISGTMPNGPNLGVLSYAAVAAGSVALLASNPLRRQFSIYNDSNRPLRVTAAATAVDTMFSFLIAANQYYESPIGGYTGALSGMWPTGANGGARVTEYLP